MINVDHFIHIGDSHKVCEDYALSGMDPIPHVIVSDGCSSSRNTDVGARILCYLARQYINYRHDVFEFDQEEMGYWIIHNAETTARHLGLNKSALDATLIVAVANDFYVDVFFFGDGYALFDNWIHSVEFGPSNAPYYLSYKLDSERNDAYHSMKNEIIIRRHTLNDTHIVQRGNLAYDKYFHLRKARRTISTASIFSDGVASFYRKEDNNMLPAWLAIGQFEMTDFPVKTGDFLKRTLGSRRGSISIAKELGYVNIDDFSMGTILLGDD